MNLQGLGHRIRTRRRALGVTQRALAEVADVSLHTVSDVESGKGNPTLATLVGLLTPLGLELDIRVRTVL